MQNLKIPISDDTIRSLKVGDSVTLSGTMLTGRDVVHKWIFDTFIEKKRAAESDDQEVYDAIRPIMERGVIYHCGPIVAGLDSGEYKFVAAGPTTSIREEPYQARVMEHFNLKGVIGKGGMAGNTLAACREVPGVYFHAIGGAASLIAQSVKEVLTVHKLDFGVPEAIWVLEVEHFPVVVTMDSHGNSIHDEVDRKSKDILDSLLVK